MRARLLIVPLIALTFTACDEKALQMAKDVGKVLSAYQAQLERRIAAEQSAYTQQAQIEAEATREQALSNLEQERLERSRGLALDILSGKQDVARWREPIRDYAKVDYSIQHDFLLADMDAQSQFVQRIQALTLDKQKIAALSKAFGALAEKPGLFDQLKGLGDFAKETSDDFEKAVCGGLAGQVSEKTKLADSTGIGADDKKKAQTAVAALQDTEKTKCCPTAK
jgi:hypothetical protein